MTNAELIEELERARDVLADAERLFVAADDTRELTDEIEIDYLRAREYVHYLSKMVDDRLNWEPRPRAW